MLCARLQTLLLKTLSNTLCLMSPLNSTGHWRMAPPSHLQLQPHVAVL